MRVLKIDYDYMPKDKKWLELWKKTRIMILESLGYKAERITITKTKRGFHAYIKINKNVRSKTANMLQFLLGDDATRVKINEWRIERGVPYWNKLFSEVVWRKQTETITCWYCGNKIPIINKK